MKISVPLVLVRLVDWLNDPVFRRYDIRRVDLVVSAGFVFCIGFYGYRYGWMGALQGGVLFIACVMLALFMRRG